MAKQKLDQYCGRLTPAQIADGINAAKQNAKRLADDARTLFEAKRFPSAASLAILALEESGKSRILRELSTVKTDEEIRQCWKEYRSHTKKNVMAVFMDLFLKGARHLSDFTPLFEENAEHPYLIDMVKQLGFYSDCLASAHWSLPEQVVNEDLARSLLFTATLFADNEREVTPREIELWIKHMAPVRHMNVQINKVALSDYYKAMQEEGLAPQGENDMEKFVFGK